MLLEFPPVIGGKRLYLLNDNGVLYGIDKHTGKVRWQRKLGALAAASPAYAGGVVYVVLLQRSRAARARRPGASSRSTARAGGSAGAASSRAAASPRRSWPTAALYFGSENGTVYAMDARNGAVRWRFKADGAVKGGLALADGRLYFGDYGGRAYAIRQSNGGRCGGVDERRRASGWAGQLLLHAGGRLRARLHGQHGRPRLLVRGDSGELAWSHSTGGYVYGSPAVAAVPGGRPPSTSAPTAGGSSRSTRAAAPSAGRAAATARSPAARA